MYLPLAVAGALGGVCNAGIQLVIPDEKGYDPIPQLKLHTGVEFLIYLFISIVVSTIITPAFSIFTVGLPNIKNFNRILIISTLSGAFLTVTVEAAQRAMNASNTIEDLRKEIHAKKETEEKAKEVIKDTDKATKNLDKATKNLDKATKNLDNVPLNKSIANLNIIELKANNLYLKALLSDDEVINSKIYELKQLKKEIDKINDEPTGIGEKKEKLKNNIDNYLNEIRIKQGILKKSAV